MASSKAVNPITFFGRLAAIAMSFVILSGLVGVSYVFLATASTRNVTEKLIYLQVICSIIFMFGFVWFLFSAFVEGGLYFERLGNFSRVFLNTRRR